MVDAGVQTAAAMAAVGTQTIAVSTADAGVEALPAVPPPAAPPQGSDPKDLTQAEGFPFPEYAEVVEWADGHRTYLPWASDPKRPTKNLLKKVWGLQYHLSRRSLHPRMQYTLRDSLKLRDRRQNRITLSTWSMLRLKARSSLLSVFTRSLRTEIQSS